MFVWYYLFARQTLSPSHPPYPLTPIPPSTAWAKRPKLFSFRMLKHGNNSFSRCSCKDCVDCLADGLRTRPEGTCCDIGKTSARHSMQSVLKTAREPRMDNGRGSLHEKLWL